MVSSEAFEFCQTLIHVLIYACKAVFVLLLLSIFNYPRKVKRVYPEGPYRNLMKLKHLSTSKNVGIFPRQLRFTTGEEVKYFCLMLHPIQVQKWQAYRTEAAIATAACFCFTCRRFLPNPTEMTFAKTSIRDHKHGKEKAKGFH